MNEQYIWRYRTDYATYHNASTYNGFYTGFPGNHKWRMWFSNSGGTLYEYGYEEFMPQPPRQVLQIENRYPAAGRQTALLFTVPINMDLSSGDYFDFFFGICVCTLCPSGTGHRQGTECNAAQECATERAFAHHYVFLPLE